MCVCVCEQSKLSKGQFLEVKKKKKLEIKLTCDALSRSRVKAVAFLTSTSRLETAGVGEFAVPVHAARCAVISTSCQQSASFLVNMVTTETSTDVNMVTRVTLVTTSCQQSASFLVNMFTTETSTDVNMVTIELPW